MGRQKREAKNNDNRRDISVIDGGESAASKFSLLDLLLNSPFSGSGLEIIRDREDFADGKRTLLNPWDAIETQ